MSEQWVIFAKWFESEYGWKPHKPDSKYPPSMKYSYQKSLDAWFAWQAAKKTDAHRVNTWEGLINSMQWVKDKRVRFPTDEQLEAMREIINQSEERK